MSSDNANSLVPVDLVEEYAEIGADKLVEEAQQYLPFLEPLGSEIPYVKTLIAAIKVPKTISDFILGRKVYSFLYAGGVDAAKIEKLKRRFSKAKQEQLWERVVFSINMHDDRRKSEIVGKIFNALIDDTISEEEFFTMVHATNTIDIHSLDELRSFYSLSDNASLPGYLYYSFITTALIDIDNSGIGALGGGGPVYVLNQTGWKYVGIVFDYPPSTISGISIGQGELVKEYDPETMQPTGHAYPLHHIQERRMLYREIDVFIVNSNGQVVCGEDQLPFVVGSKVPVAGDNFDSVADSIVTSYNKKTRGLVLRRTEDATIMKWAYLIKSNARPEGTTPRTIAEINQTINALEPKTDQIRYYVQVITEIERYLSGDLHDHWDEL